LLLEAQSADDVVEPPVRPKSRQPGGFPFFPRKLGIPDLDFEASLLFLRASCFCCNSTYLLLG